MGRTQPKRTMTLADLPSSKSAAGGLSSQYGSSGGYITMPVGASAAGSIPPFTTPGEGCLDWMFPYNHAWSFITAISALDTLMLIVELIVGGVKFHKAFEGSNAMLGPGVQTM
uniref:Ribose-5-phosphate isomerase n=1 Tax=Lygus hesperus TaxID=30085 RepID=A0A0A9ZA53_LYGHE